MFLRECLHNARRLTDRFGRALEFEEKRVGFGVFALGHAVDVGRSHEHVVAELDALYGGARVQDL